MDTHEPENLPTEAGPPEVPATDVGPADAQLAPEARYEDTAVPAPPSTWPADAEQAATAPVPPAAPVASTPYAAPSVPSGPAAYPAQYAAPTPPAAVAMAAAQSPRKHGSHALVVIVAVVLSLIFGAVAGAAGGYAAFVLLPQSGSSDSSGEITLVGESTEEVVAAAAAVALPSIVNIQVSGLTSEGDLPSGHPDTGRNIRAEGSGVAYKTVPDGGTYIITNNHVVEGAQDIVVIDSTGEEYAGELVGGDSETDIAVVQVTGRIPTIDLGDSEELVVGQVAIAIGSPFGLQGTVTSGVISALHRPFTNLGTNEGQYPLANSIQTDAAINPGNSGGALVDRDGLLIGIPSAILTETGTYEGVGLAIPVNTAVSAADQLIETGHVETPFLGIVGQTVTEELAAQESLPVEEGAYVVEVTPGTEAEKAGLQPGDVIVALDDVPIRTMDDLVLAVRRHAVGDTVTLTLWRDGEKIEVDMKVGVKPADTGTG